MICELFPRRDERRDRPRWLPALNCSANEVPGQLTDKFRTLLIESDLIEGVVPGPYVAMRRLHASGRHRTVTDGLRHELLSRVLT